jgi:aspartyl-tRNA(Asn)/glutamyl-tRNA(Gln) amidotransferase subunit C
LNAIIGKTETGAKMKLSHQEVLHIANLAKVGVTEDDLEVFSQQLSNILENFSVLQKINTDGITPTAQSIVLQNVIKCDDIKTSMSADDVLANAPQKESEFFKIKIVLEE